MNIRFKTPILRSDLFEYSDEYLAVKLKISDKWSNAANRKSEKLTFKNNAPFRLCVSKTSNLFLHIAEGFDIVMSTHNSLKHSDYRMTSRSL